MDEAKLRLFSPISVGCTTLSSRIAMAPLTRIRAHDNHVHNIQLAKEYYSQRASVSGTMLITEATFISPRAGGYYNVPGIWNMEQIAAWKEIVQAVHEKGSFIWIQLWAVGRVASPECRAVEGTGQVFGPSPLPLDSPLLGLVWNKEVDEEPAIPHELLEDEIQELIQEYTEAAKNAVYGAGFDGVEIHGANGYLVDQFLHSKSNNRRDRWGGSIENRSQFALEVCKAVADSVGADRVGIRLSPWSSFNGMETADPVPQFSHLVRGLKKLNLAYLHLIEPRVFVSVDKDFVDKGETNDPFIDIWGDDSPVLLAGGFRPENVRSVMEGQYRNKKIICVLGRYFISTPDLVYRLKNDIPLGAYNRGTFYKLKSPVGYIDYSFSDQWQREVSSS